MLESLGSHHPAKVTRSQRPKHDQGDCTAPKTTCTAAKADVAAKTSILLAEENIAKLQVIRP